MPYIKESRRNELVRSGHDMANPGELNFILTRILNRYMEQKGMSYQTINDIVGALEGCKLEYYARVARPYEDIKIKENGDVYALDPSPSEGYRRHLD